MAITNPSFEEPGVLPGQADNWDEGYDSAAEDIAAFSHFDGYTRPWDDFEQSWLFNELYQTGFSVTDVVSAEFEGRVSQRETFESGWKMPAPRLKLLGSQVDADYDPGGVQDNGVHNHSSIFAYAAEYFEVAAFTGPFSVEDFEQTWGTAPWNDASESGFPGFGAGVLSAASFDAAPQAFEDFEEEWRDNENYAPHYTLGGALSAALFDAGANAYENFEGTWPSTLP